MIITLHLSTTTEQMSRRSESQRETACALLSEKSLVRMREFRDAGIGAETVARLVRDGTVERVARGLYQLSGALPAPQHNFAEAAALVPKGVICLTSALQYHEMTLQMPSAVWMAIDRTGWKPKVEYPSIRFVRFGPKAMSEGVKRHQIDGVVVPVFEPTKTIVDCFRYRNKIGLDIALESLREGLRSKRVTPDQLWKFARSARAWTVMRPYVEAMVADGA